MAAQLSRFEPIAGVDGLFTAMKGELRCTAIMLRSGGLCLYSPVAGLSARAKDSLDDLGKAEFLFAPNHYHNKGLSEYKAAYPTARTVSSEVSRPRLERVTGLEFQGLEELSDSLQDGMRLVIPQGLKTGEVWVVIPAGKGIAWLVVDAFAGGKGTLEEGCEHVRLLGTFPKFGIGNRPQYIEWLDGFLRSGPPEILIPCHGHIGRGSDLKSQLQNLMAGLR
ncbi:MAG: hypothetical protein AAGA21_17040 [Pseudomonadota bacterium]